MKRKHRILPGGLTCVAFLLVSIAWGQTLLTGRVRNQNDDEMLKNVHVALSSYSSPAVIRYAVSQPDGRFTFTDLGDGLYQLTLSHVGFQPLLVDSINCRGQSIDLGWLSLTNKQQALDEVVIRAKKPVIHYESDRFRVDVNAMNTLGDQGMDLLGRIPGVKLDPEGTLTLHGKTGVLVYINGKQSYLTGTALIGYLKSLPASDISAIDFLPTPPASYDAAGSGGVIDIHLKKRSEDGFSINTTGSITPLTRSRSGLAMMATGRWGKWQGDGQLSVDYSPAYKTEKSDRQTAESQFYQENKEFSRPTYFAGRLGVNYQLAHNQVVGVDGGVMNGGDNSQMEGEFAEVNSAVPSLVRLRQHKKAKAQRNAFHLFYHWTIDSLGSVLTIDTDYYRDQVSQRDRLSNIYTRDHASDVRLNAHQDQFRSIDIYAVKVDWIKKIKFITLESGLKTSFVRNVNELNLDSLLGFDQNAKPGFSNDFQYLENIRAVYAAVRKQTRQIDVNAGIRYETTDSFDRGRRFVRRRYSYFFPSASLTSRFGAHQLTFSYRKSIMRPHYTHLNPFVYYTDAFSAVSGNPGLNPALAHIGELNYIFKNARLLTVNFIEMRDATLDVMTFDLLRRVNLSRPESTGLLQTWYIATGQALKLAKSWFATTDVGALYNRIVAPAHRGQWSLTAQVNSDWQFKDGWSASVLAKYASPTLYELSDIASVGTVSVGLKKMIGKGKGFVALDCNDLFYSDRYKASYRFGSLQQQTLTKWQSRVVRITLNYTFGRTVSLTHKRENAPEEIDRIKFP